MLPRCGAEELIEDLNRGRCMHFICVSTTHADTLTIGATLGAALAPGSVVGLVGDLGAGKTCLVKGIARGVGVASEEEVTSPTFVIVHEYEGPVPLYHIDAYRLESTADAAAIGIEEYLEGNGVTVIEWADRIAAALPRQCLMVHVAILDGDRRRLEFRCESAAQAGVFDRLRQTIGECDDAAGVSL